MIRRSAILSLVIVTAAGCATPILENDAVREKEEVRSVELRRVQALVSADMATAERLHAADFQVITPLGRSLSRAEYLGSVASGESDYVSWRPDEIDVRLQGPMAVIRYRWRVEIKAQYLAFFTDIPSTILIVSIDTPKLMRERAVAISEHRN